MTLVILALSVEMKGRRDSIERRAERGCKPGSRATQIPPRNWGQDWGHFGGSVTGFRLPPAAPSG